MDLYADILRQANETESPRAQFYYNRFKNSKFVCPNVTDFSKLSETQLLHAYISECKWVDKIHGYYEGQNYYGRNGCNEELSQGLDQYEYRLLALSSSFDPDWYLNHSEPIMDDQLQAVQLKKNTLLSQKISAQEKQVEFKGAVFNTLQQEEVHVGYLSLGAVIEVDQK